MRLRSCLFALTTALALHARIDASPLIFTDRATFVRPHPWVQRVGDLPMGLAGASVG
jgi:hypothetical protein